MAFRHWAVPLLFLTLIAGAVTVYFLFEPKEDSWYPKCPVYATTGLRCPGCGAQRSVHAVLHGDISKAFSFNPLFIPGMLWVALLYGLKLSRNTYPQAVVWHERLTGTISHYIWIGILLSYWILRNTLNF